MKRFGILAAIVLSVLVVNGLVGGASAAETPKARALIVVDETVYPEIKEGLDKYIDHIRWEFDTELKVLVGKFYSMTPPEIRAVLKKEYDASDIPVVGAIMVGPIPHALRSRIGAMQETIDLQKELDDAKARGDNDAAWKAYVKMPDLCPAPMYYEDFDAVWIDEDGDNVFENIETNTEDNPTEIWTAWWVPPSNDAGEQVKMLNTFLEKLDKYHSGKIDGKNGMVFIAGNGNSVEITEAWDYLMNCSMESTGNKVALVKSRHGQMGTTILPKHAEEYFEEDLTDPLTKKKWQHVHIATHGNPAGYYWDGRAITVDNVSMKKFRRTGANIITTSGCSNGNFRGKNRGLPDYSKSMGNQLLFSDRTITVAYYGAASPQSTGVFAVIHTELYEALDPETGGCIGEGYYNFRNSNYCWGTNHYFFRGFDGKVLSGDPFARYHTR